MSERQRKTYACIHEHEGKNMKRILWPRVNSWHDITLSKSFHYQDLITNSPCCLPYYWSPNWYFSLFSSLICLILYFLFKGEIMSCPTCCFRSSLKFSPPQKPNTPITNLALMPLQMSKLKHNNSHCSLLFVCAFEK